MIEDDGTVHKVELVLVQMTNGDVFVGDLQNTGNVDRLTVRSIELLAPITTNAADYTTFQTTSNTTVCFVAGTCIDTPDGPRRVETLRTGAAVLTRDREGANYCLDRQHTNRVRPREHPNGYCSRQLGQREAAHHAVRIVPAP